LDYDEHGRISRLTPKTDAPIEFEYNSNSKPIVIRQVLAGKPARFIRVEYAANGEIKKVASSDNSTDTASAVSSAFQKLLDIIRPAGVTLSF
jgi:hypothetical protein